MTKRATPIVIALGAALALSGCGRGFHLRPPAASRPVVFASFQVGYGPQIQGNRARVLDAYAVPLRMSEALRQSYPAGPGPTVQVTITQFRAGRVGPGRMHAVVHVLGPGNAVLAQFDVDSTSVAGGYPGSVPGGRGRMTRRIAQDIVNQIAQRL